MFLALPLAIAPPGFLVDVFLESWHSFPTSSIWNYPSMYPHILCPQNWCPDLLSDKTLEMEFLGDKLMLMRIKSNCQISILSKEASGLHLLSFSHSWLSLETLHTSKPWAHKALEAMQSPGAGSDSVSRLILSLSPSWNRGNNGSHSCLQTENPTWLVNDLRPPSFVLSP